MHTSGRLTTRDFLLTTDGSQRPARPFLQLLRRRNAQDQTKIIPMIVSNSNNIILIITHRIIDVTGTATTPLSLVPVRELCRPQDQLQAQDILFSAFDVIIIHLVIMIKVSNIMANIMLRLLLAAGVRWPLLRRQEGPQDRLQAQIILFIALGVIILPLALMIKVISIMANIMLRLPLATGVRWPLIPRQEGPILQITFSVTITNFIITRVIIIVMRNLSQMSHYRRSRDPSRGRD